MSAEVDPLEKLSAKEKATLTEFRNKVRDVLEPDHDDYFLLRWLKARKFNITKAEDMLRKSLIWRQNFGADDLLKWDPPHVLKKYWPGGVYGFDKQGHPILWQMSKDFDARGMMKCVKRSDVIRFFIWRMERVSQLQREQSKKLGRHIGCALHLSDLSGFNLKMVFTPGITDVTNEVFALTEANYPEHLHSSYVINAPGIFSLFFNLMKPFLAEETKRKLHFLGRNWKEELFEKVVNPDQVPVYWGGTARDPDETCSDYITHASKVPEELYIHDKITIDRGRLTEVTIPRGGAHQVEFEVSKPGTAIRWLFETESFDIGFGIYYITSKNGSLKSKSSKKSSSDSWEEFRNVSRVNSHLIPEDGNIYCRNPGTYMLKFDNSFSWVHSKKLFFEVELMEPVDDPLLQPCVDDEDEGGEDIILESTYL